MKRSTTRGAQTKRNMTRGAGTIKKHNTMRLDEKKHCSWNSNGEQNDSQKKVTILEIAILLVVI